MGNGGPTDSAAPCTGAQLSNLEKIYSSFPNFDENPFSLLNSKTEQTTSLNFSNHILLPSCSGFECNFVTANDSFAIVTVVLYFSFFIILAESLKN